MNHVTPIPNPQRLGIACLTAAVGLLTACVMTIRGGTMMHHLPDTGFHLAALLGAGAAGFVMADGFGRPGLRGMAWAILSACASTLAGSALGAVLLVGPLDGVGAAALGWLAVADALFSGTFALKAWAGAMVLLHVAAGEIRARA